MEGQVLFQFKKCFHHYINSNLLSLNFRMRKIIYSLVRLQYKISLNRYFHSKIKETNKSYIVLMKISISKTNLL
jgi:hypothetical protein